MMLAFLVDQAQQLCCPLFQAALKAACGKRYALWESIRALYRLFVFESWTHLMNAAAGVGTFSYVLADSG